MHVVDRYIATKVFRYHLTILVVAISLLLLENLPRVIAAASNLSDPLAATALTLLGVLPEYLALAGIFGIYLTSANLAYRLIRRNELSGWTSAGISAWRVTRSLAVLAIANSAMVIAMLGWLQPAGARLIVTVDHNIALGLYGIALESRRPVQLGKNATLYFDDVDFRSDHLRGVIVSLPTRVINAQEAAVSAAQNNSVVVAFRNGLVIDQERPQHLRSVHFDRLSLVVPADPRSVAADDSEPLQNLMNLPALVGAASSGKSEPRFRQIARAEALYRITLPSLALALAWFGFCLGAPDRATSSLIAVGAGLGIVVLTIRLANLGRGVLASHAFSWDVGLLLSLVSLCWAINRLNLRCGNGFIDRTVMQIADRLLLLMRRRFDGQHSADRSWK